MDGEIEQDLLDIFEEQSIKGVAFYEDGFKHFTANKELRTADDFKGLKFRTMESPIIMSQFKSLGANPVPIDFSELYNSLQLGVVEGQENPLVTIHSMKFYEVQDYLILSEHAYLGHVLLFADNWFNGLPEDIQQILISTSRDVAKWQREEVQKEEQKYLKEIEESGTNIIRLTDEEKEALRETTLPVHEEYKNMFGDDIQMRYRPHHFPFTEPSLEVDVTCPICGGKGCDACGHTGRSMELLGGGMVHPQVLENCGIDSEKYTGFAFGLGVDRIAMEKYGLDDIRLLYDNDKRFIEQF